MSESTSGGDTYFIPADRMQEFRVDSPDGDEVQGLKMDKKGDMVQAAGMHSIRMGEISLRDTPVKGFLLEVSGFTATDDLAR